MHINNNSSKMAVETPNRYLTKITIRDTQQYLMDSIRNQQ